LEYSAIPEGPYIIKGRTFDIESSIDGDEQQQQPEGESNETLVASEDEPSV
jgi:hypothetical protein